MQKKQSHTLLITCSHFINSVSVLRPSAGESEHYVNQSEGTSSSSLHALLPNKVSKNHTERKAVIKTLCH